MRYRQAAKLTPRQLAGYRKRLAELAKEAAGPDGKLSVCGEDIMRQFHPCSPTGEQVYKSFTDDELLDLLAQTVAPNGHKPHFDKLYCIYKYYLSYRFGNLPKAAEIMRYRRKCRAVEKKWPADWPERVSIEPLLKKLEQKGRTPTPEVLALLERVCKSAVKSGQPPVLTTEEKTALDRYGTWKRAFEAMGIPALKEAEARYMRKYWAEQRANSAPPADAE